MVKIIRNVVEVGVNIIVSLEVNGIVFHISIKDGEIYFTDMDYRVEYLSMKLLESTLAKLRGYYAHEEHFKELLDWYTEVTQPSNNWMSLFSTPTGTRSVYERFYTNDGEQDG